MHNTATLRFLSSIALLLSIAACSEREVDVPRLKPAALYLPNTHTVAVGTIGGIGGEDVGDLVTHSLQTSKHFAVLERGRVLDVLREQHFNASDPINVQHVGQLLGADTLILGRVMQNGLDVHVARRSIYRHDREGLEFTRRGEYNLRVLLRAVDTRTGRVVGSRDLAINEGLASSVINVDDIRRWNGREPIFVPYDPYTVQLDSYTRLADRFVKDVTPHSVKETVTMYEDRRIPMSGAAIASAQRGDWDAAIKVYQMGVEQADNNPRIPPKYRARTHYNLGVALAFSGRFDEGIQKLQDANNIWGCDVFRKTLQRAVKFKADAETAHWQTKEIACRSNRRDAGWCAIP